MDSYKYDAVISNIVELSLMFIQMRTLPGCTWSQETHSMGACLNCRKVRLFMP